MHKLLILLMFLSCSGFANSEQCTRDRMNQVVQDIANANQMVNIKYEEVSGIQSCQGNSTYQIVYCNKKFLDETCGNNIQCMQGIVAHELAHIKLNHIQLKKNQKHNQQIEFEADNLGLDLLEQAGIERRTMLIWLQIRYEIDNTYDSPTHPPIFLRLETIANKIRS